MAETPKVVDDTKDHEWQLLKSIQSWGNSVQFTCYERMQGRKTSDDKWLQEVGTRIIAAADELLALRRKRLEESSLTHGGTPQKDRVEAFIAWHQRTPHGSLEGASRIAYDAQTRVLRQLQEYLEGSDSYLNAYVDAAAHGGTAPPKPIFPPNRVMSEGEATPPKVEEPHMTKAVFRQAIKGPKDGVR